MRFRPIAKGAASYTKIGFGIELPLASNDIDVAEVEGAILAPYLLTYYQNRLIQFTSIYITRNSRVKPR